MGVPYDDGPVQNAGSVSVYVYDGARWVLTAQLTSPTPQQHDRFGTSVSLMGTELAIGARQSWGSAFEQGRVFLFEKTRDGWIESQSVESPSSTDSAFGASVILTQEELLVRALSQNAEEELQGAIYSFTHDGVDCNNNGEPDGCEITSGAAPDENNNLIPDECECLSDLDGDEVVDGADLGILLGAWGPNSLAADLTGDGKVGSPDLAVLLSDWALSLTTVSAVTL